MGNVCITNLFLLQNLSVIIREKHIPSLNFATVCLLPGDGDVAVPQEANSHPASQEILTFYETKLSAWASAGEL